MALYDYCNERSWCFYEKVINSSICVNFYYTFKDNFIIYFAYENKTYNYEGLLLCNPKTKEIEEYRKISGEYILDSILYFLKMGNKITKKIHPLFSMYFSIEANMSCS